MITKTEAVALGIGIALHASFLIAAEHAPAPMYHYDEPAPPEFVEIETPEKEEPPTLHEEVQRGEQVATNVGPREARSEELRRNPSARPRQSNEPGEVETSTGPSDDTVPVPEKRGSDQHPDEFDAPSDNTGPSIPGTDRPLWTVPGVVDLDQHGPAAPTEAPKARKVSRDKANEIIASALKEKDKNLGLQLAAAGTVASTVKDAVWSSAIPDVAQGQFVIVLGADGQVKSVKATQQAGGSSADWEAAAANIKASLATRKLLLTDEYKNGAIIAVNVNSKRQLPSGADPGSPVHLGAPGGQAGATFDVMDIGAKPIRQVRTQTSVTAIK